VFGSLVGNILMFVAILRLRRPKAN
jgi:hypothetical protein